MTGIPIDTFIHVLLIFARISSALATAPFFNTSNFPVQVRVFFGMLLAYMTFFMSPEYNFDPNYGLGGLVILALKEAMVGIAIGFGLSIIFYSLMFAGFILEFELGISLSTAFDPSSGVQSGIVSSLLFWMGLLIYILIDGPHFLIKSLIHSYQLIGIGEVAFTENFLNLLIKLSAGTFILALKLAAPIMVAFFLLHLTMGIMNRMMPQLQVFFVIMPLKTILGLFLMAGIAPLLVYVLRNSLSELDVTLTIMLRYLKG